jgi:hypothetical protein
MKAKRANSPKNSPITLSLDHPSKGPITKNTKLHARKFPEKKNLTLKSTVGRPSRRSLVHCAYAVGCNLNIQGQR